MLYSKHMIYCIMIVLQSTIFDLNVLPSSAAIESALLKHSCCLTLFTTDTHLLSASLIMFISTASPTDKDSKEEPKKSGGLFGFGGKRPPPVATKGTPTLGQLQCIVEC